MIRKVEYNSIFIYDKDGISVVFPALDGCLTCGRSEADAKLMAKDALKVWCDYRINDLHKTLLPKDLTVIELNNWVKKHKDILGKHKWKVKTIETII